MGRWKGWVLAGLVVALMAPAASAQVSEKIGACKRGVGLMILCRVIEKSVESIVEKNAQEWWDYWTEGKGKAQAAPDATLPAPQSMQARAITREGRDYSAIMGDLDVLIGGAPRGMSDVQFTNRLKDSCAGGGSRMICAEFRPLFSGLVKKSSCPAIKDAQGCSAQPDCNWRFGLCVARAS